jgi:hypothetical protein
VGVHVTALSHSHRSLVSSLFTLSFSGNAIDFLPQLNLFA